MTIIFTRSQIIFSIIFSLFYCLTSGQAIGQSNMKTTLKKNLFYAELSKDSFQTTTAIYFEEGATKGFDSDKDAYAFNIGGQEKYVITHSNEETINYSINGQPVPQSGLNQIIPIGIKSEQGEHVLGFNYIDNVDSSISIKLVDNFTNQSVDIRTLTSGYSFTITSDPLSQGKQRFHLVCQEGLSTSASPFTVTAIENEVAEPTFVVVTNPIADNKLKINIKDDSKALYTLLVINLEGQEVYEMPGLRHGNYQLNLSGLEASTIYQVILYNDTHKMTQRIVSR